MLRTTSALLLLCMVMPAVAQPAPATRPRPAVSKGMRAILDVAYVPGPTIHPRQKLDLYIPNDPVEPSRGPRPVIVYVHGGAWLGGDKRDCPALPLLAKGYAVASVNYRLSKDATFPAQIEDCKAAVRWLRRNAKSFGLDPDHFAAWGESAGGHLVALLGTMGDVKELDGADAAGGSSKVQCVIDLYGPSDLDKMNAQAPPFSRMDHDAPDSPESLLVGGPVQQNKEKAAKASPVTYVTKGDAPFLILHGDKDPLVPIGQSQQLAEALKSAGVGVMFQTLPGAGHGGKEFDAPEVRATIEAFLEKHLK